MMTQLFSWIAGLVLALLVASCGGGVGVAGGVGSGGSGLAEGTVSGFGSVLVDGVAYGDAQALVQREGESGVAEVKLGQRVRITHSQGQASTILILPQLVGTASTDADAQGEFTLLGQRVRIVSATNANLASTVFDGLSQVRAGDALEVHGLWSREGGQWLLLASRIDKLLSPPTTLLLTAPVRSRSADRLWLDDAQGNELHAAELPASVQVGSLVRARLSPDALSPSTLPQQAQSVADANLQAAGDQGLSLNAMVASSDSPSGRIRVQGLDVRLPEGWVGAAPAAGSLVQLQLKRQGAEWVASSLTEQSQQDQPSVQLKGTLDWTPNASTLQLRGTTVRLPSSALAEGCQGLPAQSEVYVTVQARSSAPGQLPVATRVECSIALPESSVQEATGVLQALQAGSVQVLVRGTVLTLQRTDRSLLAPIDWTAWLGRSVEIEYQRTGGVLVLRKLKPN